MVSGVVGGGSWCACLDRDEIERMMAERDGIRFPVTMISIKCVRATNMRVEMGAPLTSFVWLLNTKAVATRERKVIKVAKTGKSILQMTSISIRR